MSIAQLHRKIVVRLLQFILFASEPSSKVIQDKQQQITDLESQDMAVEPIQQPAMSAKQVARVLDARGPFDELDHGTKRQLMDRTRTLSRSNKPTLSTRSPIAPTAPIVHPNIRRTYQYSLVLLGIQAEVQLPNIGASKIAIMSPEGAKRMWPIRPSRVLLGERPGTALVLPKARPTK